MTISRTKKLAGLAAAASIALALAGCGAAPEDTPADGGESAPEVVEGFLPCLVSDDGGFNDKSFNQSALEGMERAAEELGVEPIEVESSSANDYAPNLENLIAEGCTFIVSVGFKLSADTIASATANPDVDYAIIDDWADAESDGETDAPNIKPLMFDTVQAAYLGGYAAAAWSAEQGVNKVGTFGGIPIPPVTIFMDGFIDGVGKYNEDKGGSVQTFGWDVAAQDGSFTGGFAANDTAKQTAQSILDQGVDVILPVGGPIYQSAGEAIADAGSDTVMIGVDSDLAVVDPDVADIVLFSIMKRIDAAVYEATMQAASGDFDVTPYVGTLENEGVGLSGFGTFESQLPEGLTDELDALREQIISGELEVTSPSSP
ncbi:BMP family ABC transporter substrate-binding protein [Microbacterium sp. M3]|uniref:BMP family ABC transporter substrate-binding protein n=1 Tax=Microbacterium arthrosphaerae TaxID=792652 RepID=A0ABU4H262_9MICO|nr:MULTISPECIES: BMP family ABC transporter substrate-binding protein [Microbacterium]MDW4573423.1 BMP family ABC transporter substrate-binding protein [Microbacterium arthrosphaerae]MDW7607278.1 BMP family ABC transporter substrate-binding protein [Microbacterium sp. M3]